MSATDRPPRRPLGTTGLDVSCVGLGAWAFGGPGPFGWGPQADADSVATVHEAVAAGIDWIDTAAIYGFGRSEEVVCRALRELPADARPRVFTKCGITWDDDRTGQRRAGDAEAIRRGAERSLERLGVEVLDLLQLHWPPQDGTPLEQAWSTLVELRAAGVARHVGVSNCDASQLARLEPLGHVDTLQPHVSLLDRSALAGTLQWCAAHGTGVIAYSPMQSGILSGTLTRESIAALPEGDWRRAHPDYTEPRLTHTLAFVAELEAIAARAGASVAELSIAWVLAQPGVSGAIVGARRPGQVAGWIGAADLTLDEATLAAIAAAIAHTGAGRGPLPAGAAA